MTQTFIRFILYINTLAVPDVASPECLNSRQRISSLEALGAADQWNEGEIGEGRWGAKRMNTFFDLHNVHIAEANVLAMIKVLSFQTRLCCQPRLLAMASC